MKWGFFVLAVLLAFVTVESMDRRGAWVIAALSIAATAAAVTLHVLEVAR